MYRELVNAEVVLSSHWPPATNSFGLEQVNPWNHPELLSQYINENNSLSYAGIRILVKELHTFKIVNRYLTLCIIITKLFMLS